MRLLVHVEGQTEETFVEQVLKPHLFEAGYTKVSARLIGNAQRRDGRGGSRSWLSVRKGILDHLKADQGAISTTMVDYYEMPQWPGRMEANARPFAERAEAVQDALATDVRNGMGRGFNQDRFIPYVSMHEFEAHCCSAIATPSRRSWAYRKQCSNYRLCWPRSATRSR